MAVFNPQVSPGRDDMPNYFKYSEPIKDLVADKSSGLALATAATGIEGAAELAKTTATDIIKKDVRETVEPIREDFTKQLEAVRAAQNNIVPNAVQTGEGVTAGQTAAAPPAAPQAVTMGLDKIQSIQEAFTNGKINDTYYDQRLKAAVTDLRSRYPGFVDLIDQHVSAITGINPANAYVNNLMQDINRAVSNKKTEEDKVLDIARTKGIAYDKGNLMYKALRDHQISEDEFMQWYGQESARDTNLQRAKSELDYKRTQGLDIKDDAKKVMSDFISQRIAGDLNGTITLNGMNKPEKIQDIITKAENDPSFYKPEQYIELAAKLDTHAQAMRTQLALETNRQGYTRDVGGANIRDEELNSQIKIYTAMAEAVRGGGSGGFGLASYLMKQATAITENRKFNLTNSTLGELADNYKELSDKFGPAVTASHILPALLEQQKKLPDLIKPLFAEKVTQAHAQSGGDAAPTTLAQHIRETDMDKRIDKNAKSYMYKGLVNTVEEIKDPKMSPDAKAAIGRYLFDPANNGVLQNWKMDYRTTSADGRLKIEHPGKYAIWTQLTDKDVSNNIAKLDDKTKAYYKSWVDITGRELIGEDVRNLNHFTGHDNLHFKWSNTGNGTPKLELIDSEGGMASPVGRPAGLAGDQYQVPKGYVLQVQAVVDRINRALPNLEHVYKSFGGGDTETMLLQTLGQYGLNFEGKITGLPKAFGDAIAASRKAPIKPKEGEK